MKLGTFYQLITDSVTAGLISDTDKGLEDLKNYGLSFVDIDSGIIDSICSAKKIAQQLKEFKIYTGSVFCWHHFPHKAENFMDIMREHTKCQLEIAAELNSKIFMPVPFVDTAHSSPDERKICQNKITEYFSDVAEQSKAYGIQTVIENYSSTNCPYSTIGDIEYILSQVPELRYVLDCGNFWFGNTDVLDAAKRFLHITDHVHLKDIIPDPEGEIKVNENSANSVAIGDGIIPFEEILSILKKSDYHGGLSIEINTCNDVYNKAIRSFNYLNKIINEGESYENH